MAVGEATEVYVIVDAVVTAIVAAAEVSAAVSVAMAPEVFGLEAAL
jgi:hypothetical protein